VYALIFLFAVVPLTIVFAVAFSPLSTSRLYITGNDVITNYDLDSFDGDSIVDGTVPELDNKLKFEPSAFWKTTEEDLEIINTYESGDIVSIEYFVTLRNKINIYTNVRLPQAIEKNFVPVIEEFHVGSYRHLALDGRTRVAWDSYLYWHHYDFGDMLDYKLRNNLFSGALKVSFDINPNPIPINFTDADGNQIEKQFDYISINAMWVSDKTYGKLSTDMPEIVGLTPAEYDQVEENDYSGGGTGGTMRTEQGDDYSHVWDPEIKLTDPVYVCRDPGIQPASVGASLLPKTKDGSNVWDPYYTRKSMEDCSFTYNLGSISPLVYEYTSQLSYKEDNIIIQDYWKSLFVLGSYVVIGEPSQESATRQVALHVTNRYIQTEFSVKFKLFTSFKIIIPETEEQELEKPDEYYDELLWKMVVDGFGGGKTYKEDIEFGGASDLITIVIVIVVVIAGIYVFVQVGVPLILRKQATDVVRKRY